jgi:hypothetical protein
VEEVFLSGIECNVSDVRQIEIHTAELKRCKLTDNDKIPTELIKFEVKYYNRRSINSLLPFGIENCLISGRSLL